MDAHPPRHTTIKADRITGDIAAREQLDRAIHGITGRVSDDPVDVDATIALIDHRQEQLQAEAMRVGERVYAEPAKASRRRLRRYWSATREPAVLARS